MQRVNVTEPTGGGFAGWFDYDTAERWSDEDPPGAPNPRHRGEAILRTARGRWVLERWTNYVGEAATYQYVSSDYARQWLERNHWDGAVERHFGAPPEMDQGGAPVTVGGSRRLVQAPDELWDAVDERAAELRVSGSEVVRRALRYFLPRAGL